MAKRQTQYMILGGVAVAAVLFVSGFYSYPTFSSNNDTQEFETIKLGAFVSLEAYHSDGTLYNSWQGHNALTDEAKHVIGTCLTGAFAFDASNFCARHLEIPILLSDAIPPENWADHLQNPTVTYQPVGCVPNSFDIFCTGWEIEGTYDHQQEFNCGGPCSIAIIKVGNTSTIDINPPIEISVGDRIIAKFTYSFG